MDESLEYLSKIKQAVGEFIRQELVYDQPDIVLEYGMSLAEAGVLDSLSVLRTVVFLEERFHVLMSEDDLVLENFESIDAIAGLVLSKLDNNTAQTSAMLPVGP